MKTYIIWMYAYLPGPVNKLQWLIARLGVGISEMACKRLPNSQSTDPEGSSYTGESHMRRWYNVGLLLGHRRRRWANNKPTLSERLVFARGWVTHDVIAYHVTPNESRDLFMETGWMEMRTEYWQIVGSMLGQRMRCWPSIKPTHMYKTRLDEMRCLQVYRSTYPPLPT